MVQRGIVIIKTDAEVSITGRITIRIRIGRSYNAGVNDRNNRETLLLP